MSVVARDARIRLASKARMRLDKKSGRHMLLYPEKGLVLNPTGKTIVELCTGEHTVEQIIDRLAATYADQPRDVIAKEVDAFVGALAERGLIEETGSS